MTKIERVATKQGHPVPAAAHAPRGPFPPELLQHEPVIWDYTPQAENGGVEEPEGGTAQNNFRPMRYFRCRDCEAIVSETEMAVHECIEWEDDEDDDDDEELEDEEEELPDGKI